MLFLFGNRIDNNWIQEIGKLRSEFPDHSFEILNTNNYIEYLVKKADGIVIGALDLGYLKSASRLKILFVPWTGLDRLPLDFLLSKNCWVANTHGNARAVAERAFSLCLSLLGKITEYDSDLRKGIWHGFSVNSPEHDKWSSLFGKTIGIIGYGSIGQKLAELLEPFHCKIIGYKKHKQKNQSFPNVTLTYTLEELIDQVEIIFIFLPLTKETKHIIHQGLLEKMEGKYIINMGRVDLIVEKDLFLNLNNKILKGLAMDVWYQYPGKENKNVFPSQYPFHELSNTVLSPHVGGFCFEGQNEMMLETIENIRHFIITGKPKYIVDLNNGY